MLSPELRCFFVRLSVFYGGWTLEAVEAVLDEPLALDYLSDLLECSLVQSLPDDFGMRFTMLEMLHAYALERLNADERRNDYFRRHAEYYCALAREADRHYQTADETAWFDRLQAEQDNLRAALAWAIDSDERLSRQLIQALWRFWDARFLWTEARKWTERVLTLPSDAPAELTADVLLAGGYFALRQGEYELAIERLQKSIEIAASLGEKRKTAFALSYLGHTYGLQSQHRQAQETLQKSLSMYQEIDDQSGIADVLADLASIAD